MDSYRNYGIYGIHNKLNNKIYIGKTMQSFGDRWDCHRSQLRGGYHDNKHLQNAWNKYGEENFDFQIIHCCNGQSVDEVNTLEMQEIARYKELGLAYNLHDGGDGGYFLGKHLSPEAKRKIGDKNRVNMTGKKLSKETKIKMSQSQLQRYAQWSDVDRIKWGQMISSVTKGIKKPKLKTIMQNNKNGAKYTVEQVKEIRRLYEIEKKSNAEIAKIFGIPRQTIYLITSYRRWKDVK